MSKVLGLCAVLLASNALYNPAFAGYQDIFNFVIDNGGGYPSSPLLQQNGVLFGTTAEGGTNSSGTIYAYDTTKETYTPIYNFPGDATFQVPYGNIVIYAGLIYGLSYYGGQTSTSDIALYQLDPSTSTNNLIYRFSNAILGTPSQGLSIWNGMFYGSIVTNPSNTGLQNGLIYQVNPVTQAISALHVFDGANDGCFPNGNPIIVGNTMYGTTQGCGANKGGTIYSIDMTSGTYTVLYSFSPLDTNGAFPMAGLTYWKPANPTSHALLYGTTHASSPPAGGTAPNGGTIFAYDLTAKTYSVLHAFGAYATEGKSVNELAIDTSGNLYGLAWALNGAENQDLFEYSTSTGNYSIIESFMDPNFVLTLQSPMTWLNGVLYGAFSPYPDTLYGNIFKVTQ